VKHLFILLGLILSISFSIGCCVQQLDRTFDQPQGLISQNSTNQKEFVKHLQEVTVALITRSQIDNEYFTYCGGVWVNDEHIVTARHCIRNDDGSVTTGTIVKYKTYNAYSPRIPEPRLTPFDIKTAIVVGFDRESDLAILSSVDNVRHKVAFISKDYVYDGQPVYIMGHTKGLEYTFMDGIVSKTREITAFGMRQKTIHVTSHAWKGNSGGGAYDSNGKLVGICSFLVPPGAVFFIHKDVVVDLLEENNIEYY